MLALSIWKKRGFIDGTIEELKQTDSLYEHWYRYNSLIVAWLLESLTPAIASNVIYMDSTKEIWVTLKNHFSQPDETRIRNLQFLLGSIMQGTRSVDAYFTKLNFVWQELKNFRALPQCDCGGCKNNYYQKYADQHNKDAVFRFLNGLNDYFSALRSHIIMLKPFPSLDQDYSLVILEESQRSMLMQSQSPIENSAMAATITDGKRESNANIVCSHCGKKRHFKEKCYRIIRFLKNFKFTKSKGNF